nr:hypothetical protein [Gordonia sp. NB41Y]
MAGFGGEVGEVGFHDHLDGEAAVGFTQHSVGEHGVEHGFDCVVVALGLAAGVSGFRGCCLGESPGVSCRFLLSQEG